MLKTEIVIIILNHGQSQIDLPEIYGCSLFNIHIMIFSENLQAGDFYIRRYV